MVNRRFCGQRCTGFCFICHCPGLRTTKQGFSRVEIIVLLSNRTGWLTFTEISSLRLLSRTIRFFRTKLAARFFKHFLSPFSRTSFSKCSHDASLTEQDFTEINNFSINHTSLYRLSIIYPDRYSHKTMHLCLFQYFNFFPNRNIFQLVLPHHYSILVSSCGNYSRQSIFLFAMH